MRKRTAPRTRQRQLPASSPKQTAGLIARKKNPSRSAGSACALDNRSHRTTLRFSCEAVRLTLDGFCGPLLAISAQCLSRARDPSGPSAACG